jgi:dephospho-CoA kinase
MLRVALTGGIATGKSHILAQLASLDISIIDADALVHELMKPGAAVTAAVVARFGAGVQQPDGSVDRKRLGALVFADAAARRDLEAIVHPAVYEAIASWLARLDAEGTHAFAVADVPLLYETGRAGEFDRVIVAACPPEMQLARVVARDGLSETEATQRLAAQWPIGQKIDLADFVIRTDGTFEETNRRVEEIVGVLEGE